MNNYIALFEFIGFESFIKNNSTSGISEKYEAITTELKNAFLEKKESTIKGKDDFEVSLFFQGKHILLISSGEGPRSFFDILSTSQILLVTSLAEGFPLRGCVDIGDIGKYEFNAVVESSIPNEILISQVYWSAILTLSVNPMTGCLLSNRAVENFEEIRTKNTYTIEDLIRLNLLGEFFVANFDEPVLAVNWMADVKLSFNGGFLASIFAKHEKEVAEEEEYLIGHTLSFMTSVQSKNLN